MDKRKDRKSRKFNGDKQNDPNVDEMNKDANNRDEKEEKIDEYPPKATVNNPGQMEVSSSEVASLEKNRPNFRVTIKEKVPMPHLEAEKNKPVLGRHVRIEIMDPFGYGEMHVGKEFVEAFIKKAETEK